MQLFLVKIIDCVKFDVFDGFENVVQLSLL